jgi:hypothetical protein
MPELAPLPKNPKDRNGWITAAINNVICIADAGECVASYKTELRVYIRY